MPTLSEPDRAMLLALTALPTAAGYEDRVIAYIRGWCAERPMLRCIADDGGNLVIERVDAPGPNTRTPLYITAHMDHPCFVVTRVTEEGGTLELEFRGGVKDPYFRRAPLIALTREDAPVRATLESMTKPDPYRLCIATVHDADHERARELVPGDLARWAMPDASIEPASIEGREVGDVLWTHACDDLAALGAALAMMDRIVDDPDASHVRLLLTRAEEVGFVGAIHACKHGTLAHGSRVVLLENSRASMMAPIGDGPIVRVGDRMSTFDPALTGALGHVAKELEKERAETDDPFRWQRRLMTGGACEATCYQAYGYAASCLCLPLGNYHNMAELDRVDDEEPEALDHARCAREHVAISDWLGLVDLLVACATHLGEPTPVRDRMEQLYEERSDILRSGVAVP